MNSNFNTLKIIPIKNIAQDNDFSCGAAVYCSILQAFNLKITLAEAKQEVLTTEVGTRSRDIESALIKRNIKVDRINNSKIKISDLKKYIDQGFIILTEYVNWNDTSGHFCIVCGFTDTEVVLVDPWLPNNASTYNKDYLLIKNRKFLKMWPVTYYNENNILVTRKLVMVIKVV